MTPAQPVVSVILASYKHAQYVHQAIDSVLAQTYPHWELLIVDDGSPDGSHQAIRGHPQIRDPRIRLFLHQENRGHSRRINEMVAEARGSFVCWLPSDDWYLPRKLELQVAAFDRLGPEYGLTYANGYRYYEDTKEMREYRTREPAVGSACLAFLRNPGAIQPITPMMRKECFLRYPMREDYFESEMVLLRFAMTYKFHFLEEFVVVMRAHTYNSGSSPIFFDQAPALLSLLFDEPDCPPEVVGERDHILGAFHRLFAWNGIRQHSNPTLWQRSLRRALARDPWAVARDPRTYLGAAMSVVPAAWLRVANRQLTRSGLFRKIGRLVKPDLRLR